MAGERHGMCESALNQCNFSFTPRLYVQRERCLGRLCGRVLGGSLNNCGRFWRRENFFEVGIEPRLFWPQSVPTALSRPRDHVLCLLNERFCKTLISGKDKNETQCACEHHIEAHSCSHCCSGRLISIIYYVCVSSLSYPGCNAHAPYCHLWHVRPYYIFLRYLINGTIFGRKR
jgi:hypothetical protein